MRNHTHLNTHLHTDTRTHTLAKPQLSSNYVINKSNQESLAEADSTHSLRQLTAPTTTPPSPQNIPEGMSENTSQFEDIL